MGPSMINNSKYDNYLQILFIFAFTIYLYLLQDFCYWAKKLDAQWAEPVSLIFHSALSKLNTQSSIGASHQVSVHLIWPSSLREAFFFRNTPIRNKNCLWQPCLLANRDEMSNLYRGPSMHASYHISVHLGKWFQRRRFFRNKLIKSKNGLFRPCLLTD